MEGFLKTSVTGSPPPSSTYHDVHQMQEYSDHSTVFDRTTVVNDIMTADRDADLVGIQHQTRDAGDTSSTLYQGDPEAHPLSEQSKYFSQEPDHMGDTNNTHMQNCAEENNGNSDATFADLSRGKSLVRILL